MKIEVDEKNLPFLKPEDVSEGASLKFNSEGEMVEGQYGKRYNFVVEFPDGKKRVATLNPTSLNWMIEKYGDDSAKWVGEMVPVFKVKQMVGKGMKEVVYFGEEPTSQKE